MRAAHCPSPDPRRGAFADAASVRLAYRIPWDRVPAGWPLAVRSAGHAVVGGRFREGTRRRDLLQVLWSIDGEGACSLDAGTVRLCSGDWLWLPPGIRYHLCAAGSRWEFRWLTIDGPATAAWTAGWPPPTGPCRPRSALDTRLHDRLIACLGEATTTRLRVGLELASSLVIAGLHGQEHGDLVDQALAAIETRHADPAFDATALARLLHCHRSHLGRACNARLGAGPGELLRLRRLRAAQELLLARAEARLDAVASAAGFAGRNQMARVFRNSCGIPPEDWRRTGGFG